MTNHMWLVQDEFADDRHEQIARKWQKMRSAVELVAEDEQVNNWSTWVLELSADAVGTSSVTLGAAVVISAAFAAVATAIAVVAASVN